MYPGGTYSTREYFPIARVFDSFEPMRPSRNAVLSGFPSIHLRKRKCWPSGSNWGQAEACSPRDVSG